MSGRGRGRGRGRGGYTPPTGAQLFLRRSLDECGLAGHNIKTVQDITRPSLFPSIRLHSTGDQRLLAIEQQKQRQKEEEEAAAARTASAVAPGIKSEDGGGGENAATAASAASNGGKTPVRVIPRSAQTLALIGKSREMHHRIQNSVHYVRPSKDVPDVIRYSEHRRRLQQQQQQGGGAAADDAAGDPTAVDATAVLSACLGGRKRTRLGLYVPDELACGQRINVRGRTAGAGGLGDAVAAGKAVSLTELEEIELKRARAGSVGGGAGAGGGVGGRARTASAGQQGEAEDHPGDFIEEEEEEEEGEDYVMNYYESEGEEGSDGGAEPTF